MTWYWPSWDLIIIAAVLFVLFSWMLAMTAIFLTLMRNNSMRKVDNRSTLDIARERYARGELTREQFEQISETVSLLNQESKLR